MVSTGSKSTSSSSGGAGNIKMLEIAGGSVPLPANNLLGDLSVTGGSGSGSGGVVTSSAMKELGRLTEFVGRKLALMYGEQLDFIGAESAWLLGECAAKEMIGFLWTDNLISPGEESESESERGRGKGKKSYVEAVGMQLIEAVSAVESEEESGKTKEKKIHEKMTTGMMNESWKFSTKIMTSTHEEWSSDGIFHRAGILVEKDDGKKLWYSGGPTNPERFGYRRGSEDEVKANSKLKQTRERVSTQVRESQVFNEGSKAAKKHYDNVAAAAQGNKEEMELIRKQMQVLLQNQKQEGPTAQIQALQSQVEKLTALVAFGKTSANPTSVAAKPPTKWTTVEVVTWLREEGHDKLGSIVEEQELDGMILFGLYSARETPEYRTDCSDLGFSSTPLQIKLKGVLVILFDGEK